MYIYIQHYMLQILFTCTYIYNITCYRFYLHVHIYTTLHATDIIYMRIRCYLKLQENYKMYKGGRVAYTISVFIFYVSSSVILSVQLKSEANLFTSCIMYQSILNPIRGRYVWSCVTGLNTSDQPSTGHIRRVQWSDNKLFYLWSLHKAICLRSSHVQVHFVGTLEQSGHKLD